MQASAKMNVSFLSWLLDLCRKLKKLLRKRKSDLDSKQEEQLNKTLQRHEKDHLLGPFVGINPEYMEMSESLHQILSAYPEKEPTSLPSFHLIFGWKARSVHPDVHDLNGMSVMLFLWLLHVH